MQRCLCGGVLIPQALDRFRPGGNLLHLVQDQQAPGPAPLLADLRAGRFPLLLDPDPVLQDGFIGGSIVPRASEVGEDLAGKGRLSRLAGSRKHLDKPPWLAKPFCDDLIHRALVHDHLLIIYSIS